VLQGGYQQHLLARLQGALPTLQSGEHLRQILLEIRVALCARGQIHL
jgi:hypothetical protein